MESPALRELQRSFFGYVAGPVEATWDVRGSIARGAVRGDATLTTEDRLGIYRGMCLARLVDVLRDDFADVADALGASAFDAIARSYVIENPSSMPSIQHVSDRFPEYLEAALDERPELAERAAVDRARLAVFSETDPSPLTLERLQAMPTEQWGSVQLMPIAALRVITRAWSDDDGPVRPRPHVVRVWRQKFEIFQATVDVTEAGALDLLFDGGTTLEALGAFVETGRSAEAAARESGSLLLRWLEDGILEAPELR